MNKLPLELRLIIYEYFDPKNCKVIINGIWLFNIIIKSEQYFQFNFDKYSICFWAKSLNILTYTIGQQFYLRKSQVDKCIERLKQIK